jgi:hypothetical protein
MQNSNARVYAVVGVVVAAIAAACLVMPAARQLGAATGLLTAAAILGIPVLAVLLLGLLALRVVPARSADIAVEREAQNQ